jgi:hypothetical protein
MELNSLKNAMQPMVIIRKERISKHWNWHLEIFVVQS